MDSYGLDDLTSRVVALDARATTQQRFIANLEARISTCEAATAISGPAAAAGGPGGRLVAARVAALEGAHQAEIADLRRSLDEALVLSREQEQLQRKQRSSTRELDQQVEDAESRTTAIRDTMRSLEQHLERLRHSIDGQSERALSLKEAVTTSDSSLSAQERRAQGLEEVVEVATAGLARLGKLLDSQERRTADLGHGIGSSSEKVTSPQDKLVGGSNEPVWEALRELQELVVHESEHRAAGLREVLSVMGQTVEQLRGEQARSASESESKCRADFRRAEQRLVDSLSRHTEHEKRAEALEHRISMLSQGLTADRVARDEQIVNVETQIQEARGGRVYSPGGGRVQGPRVQSPRGGCVLTPRTLVPTESYIAGCASNVVVPAPHSTQMVTSQSLLRLEALEARFDRGDNVSTSFGAGMIAPVTLAAATASDAKPTLTADTLGKLRGQLDGLRSELAGDDGGRDSARLAAMPVDMLQDQGRVAEITSIYPMRPLAADRCFTGPAAQVALMPSSFGSLPADNLSSQPERLEVLRSVSPSQAPPTLLALSTSTMAGTMPAAMRVSAFSAEPVANVAHYVPAVELGAQDSAVSRSASTPICVCGSLFLEGSNFCLKCGSMRPLNGLVGWSEPVLALAHGDSLPSRSQTPSLYGTVPGAMVGLDLNHDGRADLLVSGPDLNRDGIPDVLQQPHTTIFAFPEAVVRQPSQPQTPVASARRMVTTGPAKVARMREQPQVSEPCHATEPVACATQQPAFQQWLQEPWTLHTTQSPASRSMNASVG